MKKLLLLPLIVVSLFLFTHNVSAASNIPGTSLSLNGSVSAIVTTSTTTYVGGFFSNVGNNTLDLAQIATSNGVSSASFPAANGQIYTIISDGNGGWYVGGAFTTIGAIAKNRLAHIKSDNSVDSLFSPNMSNTVTTLALSSDGSILYAGGLFNTVGATTRNYLAALTTSNGFVVSGFNPNMNGPVNALALSADNTTLYVGGGFTTVNGGTTANSLTAFTTSNGLMVSAFNPNMNSTVSALALSSDGSTLYAGGSFTTVNGSTTANRLAAFTTSNGTMVSAFNPNINNAVWSLALSSDGSTLYAGGAFNGLNSVNGNTTRNYLASFTTSNGTVVSGFNPSMDNYVFALTLSADGSTLYVGGQFSTVNGSTTRNNITAVTTSNGTITSFNPNISGPVYSLALSSDGLILYTGGNFTTVNGGTTRNRLTSFTTSNGTVTNFNPNINSTVSAIALSSSNATLYAGGQFVTANGYSRPMYAVLNVLQPSNQNAVFPSSIAKQPGATISIISSGDATNQIWFAPAGASSFSVGSTMTQAGSGISTTILAPTTDGVYYLYVLDTIGDISPASTATLTVDSVPPSTPVASPDTGTYIGTQSVSLSASGGSTIQYSTAGIPVDCTSDTSYSAPISVSSSETIYVRACDLALNSSIASFAYTIAHNGGHPIPTIVTPAPVAVSQSVAAQPTQIISVTPTVLQSPTVLPILKLEHNLTIGITATDVETLQQFLVQQNAGPNARALATYRATNYFGPLTKKALAEWQRVHNLPANGYFGSLTRSKILAVVHS